MESSEATASRVAVKQIRMRVVFSNSLPLAEFDPWSLDWSSVAAVSSTLGVAP
jgi:hypothetical protein